MRVEGGAYKMKGAADTPNSPNWKEIGIYYPDKVQLRNSKFSDDRESR